jgi:hypothetical protein
MDGNAIIRPDAGAPTGTGNFNQFVNDVANGDLYYAGLLGVWTKLYGTGNTVQLKRQVTTLTTAKLRGLNMALVLTECGNAVGGLTVYTGAITGGAANALVGGWYTIAGFGAGNGTFKCVASTALTLTLANPGGVAQVVAATATNLGFQVVDAPGANKIIDPKGITLQYKYATAAFTIGNIDNAFYMGFETAIGVPMMDPTYLTTTAFLDQAANNLEIYNLYAYKATLQSVAANHALVLGLFGTTPALTVGDGSVVVTVEYTVVDLL